MIEINDLMIEIDLMIKINKSMIGINVWMVADDALINDDLN